MKIVNYSLLTIWYLWCLYSIIKNYSKYGIDDWIVILVIMFLPNVIMWFVKYRAKKQRDKDIIKNSADMTAPVDDGCVETAKNISTTSSMQFVESTSTFYLTKESPISDEEVPTLIQTGYEETMRQNAAVHNYPMYMNMRIVSNTIPAHENYAVLNDNEKMFFQALSKQLTEAKLSPSLVKFTRMSDGGFNVDYIGLCYIGKINLYQPPAKYAVKKSGNKRATKVFDTLLEAQNYVLQNKNYEVEIRQPKSSNSMQYLRGFSTIKNLSALSIEQCIGYIPYWIRYIKYCKRN